MEPFDVRDPSPPDVVTGVVQHEYFKFQVQKQVEAQVQAYLAARAKAVGAILTVAVTMLGAFGVSQYLTFTSIVDEVKKQSMDLGTDIDKATALADKADARLQAAEPLLEAAKDNVQNSREVTASVSAAAQQTTEFARSVLQQAQRAQTDVLSRSKDFETAISGATKTIEQLTQTKQRAEEMTAALAYIPATANEVKQHVETIRSTAEKVEQTQRALDENLNIERQLMMAKTFEIVLLRDRRAVEITLPDVRNPKAQPYKFTIEATRIKNDVDFRIAVNDGKPVLAFDRFVQGQRAVIADDVPFEVRVDSIYHAKLAYDFVLLRIKPNEGPSPVTRTAITSSADGRE